MTKISMSLPETEAYRICAIGHLNAAKLLYHGLLDRGFENTDSTWLALQNLIGFAAENALKTYLSSQGVERKQLRKRDLGHDLNAMLEKSVELGLASDGDAISQPQLVSALRRYTDLCGGDFTSFNYRYLEGESVQILSAGEATTTVIRAIECIIEIAEKGRFSSQYYWVNSIY